MTYAQNEAMLDRAVYGVLYGTWRQAGTTSALAFPVNGVLCSRTLRLIFLSLPSRTQHMVTLPLVAAVQLPMSSVDVCIDLRLVEE